MTIADVEKVFGEVTKNHDYCFVWVRYKGVLHHVTDANVDVMMLNDSRDMQNVILTIEKPKPLNLKSHTQKKGYHSFIPSVTKRGNRIKPKV